MDTGRFRVRPERCPLTGEKLPYRTPQVVGPQSGVYDGIGEPSTKKTRSDGTFHSHLLALKVNKWLDECVILGCEGFKADGEG
jgi:hypothetical protein